MIHEDDSHTFVAIAHSPEVSNAAATVLGQSVSPARLVRETAFRLSARPFTVAVEVTDRSAADAAAYADAMAASLRNYIVKVTTEPGRPPAIATPQVTPAEVPRSPLARPLVRDLIIGIADGLLLAALIAVARRMSGASRPRGGRSAEEHQVELGHPVG